MTILAFVALAAACAVVLVVFWLLEQNDSLKDVTLSGATGIKKWRDRLNTITDGFVALGTEPLLKKAVSTTEDPQLNQLRGDTLTRYKALKSQWTALSFAYNGSSRVVKKAESLLNVRGLWKSVTIRRAVKSLEDPIMIKEINPAAFVLALPKNAPKTPLYLPDYLFSVCERLIADIKTGLAAIKDAPGKVQTRLGNAEGELSKCETQRQDLHQKGIDFVLYKDRKGSIEVVHGQVTAMLASDPFGALTRCEELDRQIKGLLGELSQAAQVHARLQGATQSLTACEAQNEALSKQEIAYAPYKDRVAAINTLREQVEGAVGRDPGKALGTCAELDKAIKALASELTQAANIVKQLDDADLELSTKEEWVTKIRGTAVTCPWADARESDAPNWLLNTADSNPDSLFAQSKSLLSQARGSLASGNFPVISGEIKQAETARNQGAAMVQAQFDTKNTVDEQVPRVRAELTALHGEVLATTGGSTSGEMSQLVQKACGAVEDRLHEIRDLYGKQKFVEAASLLTGTQGNEHGMPISKLLAQAKELCRLLKQAAEVAGNVQAQLAK
jgi:hypothetical protein